MLTIVAITDTWAAADVACAQQFGVCSVVAVDPPWRSIGDTPNLALLETAGIVVRRVTAPPLFPGSARVAVEVSALMQTLPRSFVALGPVGAAATPRGPWRAAGHLLEAAAKARLPVLLSCPTAMRRHHTRALLGRARAAGVSASRIAVHGVDHTNARLVADAGATALLVVGGGRAGDADALAAAADFGPLLPMRMGIALPLLPGIPDLTAPARLLEALQLAGTVPIGLEGPAVASWLGA